MRNFVTSLFIIFILFLFPAITLAEKTVIIDPGHGGTFSGAVGVSGYLEKEGNLQIGLLLRSILEDRGYTVYMTRDTDKDFGYPAKTDLENRMKLANGFVEDRDNAVFISIHHNSTTSSYARGYETYYFDANEGIDQEYPPDPIQVKYADESNRFAHTIHKDVLSIIPMIESPRGIVENDLFVTRNAQMPSALVEFGYLSNPKDESLVKTSDFQQKAAEGLAKGIDTFFKVFEVYDYQNNKLAIFQTKEEAVNYAKTKEKVYVFDKYNQVRIFSNIDERYGVYHFSTVSLNKLFVSESEALAYAQSYKNTRVVDNKTGLVLWSNYLEKNNQVISSSGHILFEDYNEKKAIDFASKESNVSVINKPTGQVLWTNYLTKDFEVSHSVKGSLDSFYSKEEAIEYAMLWDNTKVTNLKTKEVIFDNTKLDYKYSFRSDLLSGKDRIKTAIEVSKDLYPNGFHEDKTQKKVILSTAYEFADALSASPLAAKYDNAPILLTRSDSISDEVLLELKRLGAREVTIIGGTAALSSSIEDKLANLGYTVDRIQGATRIETNLNINSKLVNIKKVFVASSASFPDSLQASSIAVLNNMAIVLTEKDSISPKAMEYLNAKDVVILGGTEAISSSVEKKIVNQIGADRVNRIGGATRYDTVAMMLEAFKEDIHSDTVIAATGKNFPDALTASTLSVQTAAPLVLIGDTISPSTTSVLETYVDKNVVSRFLTVGGVISDENRKKLEDLLK